MWIPDHFFIRFTTAELGILGNLSALLIQSVTGPCYDTWRHDMPSFWTDPADIRIRINPDSNPGSHFGLGRVCSLRVLLFLPYVNQFELTAATYFDIDGERHDEQSDHDVGDGQRDDEVVGSGL